MSKALVWTILILCGVDATLTLWGVQAGRYEELNPFMLWFLRLGEVWFIGVKMILTGIGAWFLNRMHEKDGATSHICLHILFWFTCIYVALTGWHIHLILVAQ